MYETRNEEARRVYYSAQRHHNRLIFVCFTNMFHILVVKCVNIHVGFEPPLKWLCVMKSKMFEQMNDVCLLVFECFCRFHLQGW